MLVRYKTRLTIFDHSWPAFMDTIDIEITPMGQMVSARSSVDNNSATQKQLVIDEIYQVSPYLKLLHQQLVGAMQDTEEHVMAIIVCFGEISGLSSTQKNRIVEFIRSASLSNDSAERTNNRLLLDSNSPEINSSCVADFAAEFDLGSNKILGQVTEALCHLQFQDVLRQRIEQVQSAIIELDQHFSELAANLSDADWDGQMKPTLQDRMLNHFDQYVMQSQRDVYASMLGSKTQE